MGYQEPLLSTLADCVARRNLFLIHIGHSWIVIRATGKQSAQGGAIPLALLNDIFPKAVMIDEIQKLTTVARLQEYMDYCGVSKDAVISKLNTPLPQGGYQSLMGASSEFPQPVRSQDRVRSPDLSLWPGP